MESRWGYQISQDVAFDGVVSFNGKVLPSKEASLLNMGAENVFVSIMDPYLIDLAHNSSIAELLLPFYEVSAYPKNTYKDLFEEFDLLRIRVSRTSKYGDDPRIVFTFSFEIEDWNHPWSIRQHSRVFQAIVMDMIDEINSSLIGVFVGEYDVESSWIEMSGRIVNVDDSIKQIFDVLHPVFDAAIIKTVIELSTKDDAHTITIPFAFPPEVKVACQQYLVYFAQFLADVGIDATADLQEKAGQVLFSVTPTDKDEALDHIREALAVYLQLPGNPNIAAGALSTDIDVQRLTANIYHLNGELTLAGIAIKQQDALLEMKEGIIRQQREIIDGQILVTSMQKEVEDSEPLVADMVSVKKVEAYGVEFDLPTILRKLKERFKKKK